MQLVASIVTVARGAMRNTIYAEKAEKQLVIAKPARLPFEAYPWDSSFRSRLQHSRHRSRRAPFMQATERLESS